jgi:type VI protein secretion system component Hcp
MRYQLSLIVMLVFCLWLPQIQAASGPDIFVNIEGLTGSEEAPYTDPLSWIPAIGLSEGLMREVGVVVLGGGGGGGASHAEFQDFAFTKEIDSVTPGLHVAVASGMHFPRMLVDVVESGDPEFSLRIELEEIEITGAELESIEDSQLEQGGGPCSKLRNPRKQGGPIHEKVSVAFRRICWTVPGNQRCWDLQGNTEP